MGFCDLRSLEQEFPGLQKNEFGWGDIFSFRVPDSRNASRRGLPVECTFGDRCGPSTLASMQAMLASCLPPLVLLSIELNRYLFEDLLLFRRLLVLGNPMRYFMSCKSLAFVALLSLAGFGLSGCGLSGAEDLVGEWRTMAGDDLAKKAFGQTKPEGLLGQAQDMIVNASASSIELTYDFQSNGDLEITTKFPVGQSVKAGSWKVVSKSGEERKVEMVIDEAEPVELSITVVDENTIRLVPPNQEILGELSFKRVEKK